MRVFLTSPWIPAEWVRAHGHEPRGIWFEENFQHDAPTLSAGVCAFAEQAVRFAESQPDVAVIFTTTCDQLRRGFDVATFHGRSRAFLFNIPVTRSPAAKQIYRDELERLGRFLLELGGTAPTPEILRREMLQADRIRRHLPASEPLPVASGDQVPLAIVGGPLCLWHRKLLETIEVAGGRVVLNATENGERSLGVRFDLEADGDPFDLLVAGYFENIADVFQRPNARLYSWLKPRLLSCQARGIVLWHFTGCDLWRAEAPTLREAFGLPVLLLEAPANSGAPARSVNRIQAFVETLK